MSQPDAGEGKYQGNELELFCHAQNWKRYFRAAISPYIGQRVAEVGAGNGSTTEVLCAIPHKVWFALEPDAGLIACIEEKCATNRLPRTVKPVHGSLVQIRAADLFDTILYIDVLEHIADDQAELRHAAELLAPEGTVIVLSPAYPYLYTAFDAAIGHYRRYTLGALQRLTPERMLLERGFYLDSVGVFASLANLLLLKQSQPTLSQIVFWDRFVVPCSRIMDPVVARAFGRSVVAIWRRHETA